MKPAVLDPVMQRVFGKDDDPMPAVEARARAAYPDRRIIVWEGDAQTFAFGYVGGDAEALLGHAPSAWTRQADFWTTKIVHPEDRDDAVAFCALATGKATDHVFEYRAISTTGGVHWLEDYVRVVCGARGIPVRLRGLMLDVTEDKRRAARHEAPPRLFLPTREELQQL